MAEITEEVAECVGLWLAEGDNKTTRELTFTNNCLDLILFFKENISNIYTGNNKPLLYIYSPIKRQLFKELDGFKKINFYIDTRANRPYYIYRLNDSNFLKYWKKLVKITTKNKKMYNNILRGIFAGEGNIKHNIKAHSRSIRISAKAPNILIEKMLNFYKINYKFDFSNRMYSINARYLDISRKIRLTELHPEKGARFDKMMNSFSEKHYKPLELKSLLLKELTKFKTTKQLSKKFKRSELRISEVLQKLKKEDKIDWIKIKQNRFWVDKVIKNEYLLVEKRRIISKLMLNSYTSIGKNIGLYRKSISRRFKSYEEENLIQRHNGWWKLTEKGQKLVAGIDESGREIKLT